VVVKWFFLAFCERHVPSITLKDIPEELHQRLKTSAARHHRSINREAVALLEEALMPAREPPEDVLRRIRALRDKYPATLTASEITALKNAGRP
jgi:plasmid stability protein